MGGDGRGRVRRGAGMGGDGRHHLFVNPPSADPPNRAKEEAKPTTSEGGSGRSEAEGEANGRGGGVEGRRGPPLLRGGRILAPSRREGPPRKGRTETHRNRPAGGGRRRIASLWQLIASLWNLPGSAWTFWGISDSL
jgi:hypothetical protein